MYAVVVCVMKYPEEGGVIKGPVTLTSASAFATRFCVKFYATLLRSLCRVTWSHCDRTSAEYHGAKEDSLLFLKFQHGHMVSRVKISKKAWSGNSY